MGDMDSTICLSPCAVDWHCLILTVTVPKTFSSVMVHRSAKRWISARWMLYIETLGIFAFVKLHANLA
jgi:hypothetical protein